MTKDVYTSLFSKDKPSSRHIEKQPRAAEKQFKHPLSWLDEHYSSVRGETALWVAVITQALQDALTRCKKAESQYHKHEAAHWLTGNSKDFVAVCLSADLDPDYVRQQAKKAIAAPRA